MRLLQCSAKPGALEKLWGLRLFPSLTEVLQLSPEDLFGELDPSMNAPKCFDLERTFVT